MQTKPPLISFVVVTHDRPPDLVRSRIIRTIAVQEYSHCEIVLVGETCPHFKLLVQGIYKEFPGIRIKWAELQRALGAVNHPWAQMGRCRNYGISLAAGEFISCQDDDNELERDFAASLLDCLLETGSEAVWCHRRLVMPDGSPYPGTFFPWADLGTFRERLIYEMWREAGALTPGSDIVKDQLMALHHSETFSTVDANEWLVRAPLYRQFPFRERFGFYDLMANSACDDVWNCAIRAAGVKVACTGKASLLYHLGGESNRECVDKWLALNASNGFSTSSEGGRGE
jgi:Glycosyl transferase family 2